MAAHTALRYTWSDAAILRATTRAEPADLPRTLDVENPDVVRGWLRRLWQSEDIRAVLHLASPSLRDAVEDVLDGAPLSDRTVRRTAMSVAAYLLRWANRPTPFGLFAGVAPLTVGGARVGWGIKHHAVVRADSAWLTDVIVQLERDPKLLERLTVMANNAAVERGGRLVAPGPPADGRTRHMAHVEVSVPLRRPVRTALGLARMPIRYGHLRAELAARFPSGTVGQIDTLLTDLILQNLLCTNLHAPMTTVDALAHVCSELEQAGANDLPVTSAMARELRAVRDDLAHCAPAALEGAVARMTGLSTVTKTPLLVDTALDVEAVVPRDVLVEAERAVSALYRTSPLPYGHQHWRDYHRRFRARYGVGAAVSVLELVADSGLGWPAGYVGSERVRAPVPRGDRDTVVLALVQDALRQGRSEIVLSDSDIDRLARAAGTDEPAFADRVELAFEIRAATLRDLQRGAFRLAVTGAPRPGSSMAGRFAHLLPTDQQGAWARTYTTDPEAITAQLSFAPRRRRDENVTRIPRLLDTVIPLVEHPADEAEALRLDDIAVTGDARRLWLVQLSTGRRIEPRVLHALEAGTQTPPLARFLAEITGARCATYTSFDYGPAARLPYLPRVRYRRTILSPARWLLTASEMPGRRATMAEWEEAFTAWRARISVPDRVAMVRIEQRLPLDLTHPVHRRLLRARLDEAGHVELRESADPDEYGWIGRPHEVLIALARTAPGHSNRPTSATKVPEPHLPGAGTVLHAHLHAHPQRFEEILDAHVPELLDSFVDSPQWWFVRHRVLARPHDGQHLALTLHLPDGCDYGTAAAHVHVWVQRLHRARLASDLTLASYQPQTGRYGHGPATDAAHALFAADSHAALAQIRMASTDAVSRQALAAASMLDLALSLDPDNGAQWMIDELPQGRGRLYPDLRDQVLHLTRHGVAGSPDGDVVAQAWEERANTLHTYRKALADQRAPRTVLRSLLHQHYIRALPVDAAGEATTLRLARTASLRRIRAAS